MIPEIPTDPVAALTLLANVVIVPLLVIILGKTKLSGDGKRYAVLAVSVLLGVVNAIVTNVLVAPDVPATLAGWLTLIITYAAVIVVYSQAWYLLLASKIGAKIEPDPSAPVPEGIEG